MCFTGHECFHILSHLLHVPQNLTSPTSFICRSWICPLLHRRIRSSLTCPTKDVLVGCIVVTQMLMSHPPAPRWSTPPCPGALNLDKLPALTKGMWAAIFAQVQEEALRVTIKSCFCHLHKKNMAGICCSLESGTCGADSKLSLTELSQATGSQMRNKCLRL